MKTHKSRLSSIKFSLKLHPPITKPFINRFYPGGGLCYLKKGKLKNGCSGGLLINYSLAGCIKPSLPQTLNAYHTPREWRYPCHVTDSVKCNFFKQLFSFSQWCRTISNMLGNVYRYCRRYLRHNTRGSTIFIHT